MYRFICQTKDLNGNIKDISIQELEHKSLRFKNKDEAWYFYQEWFDGREMYNWNPTYNGDDSEYRIIIKEEQNKMEKWSFYKIITNSDITIFIEATSKSHAVMLYNEEYLYQGDPGTFIYKIVELN